MTDWAWAERLWKADIRIRDIAEEVGVTPAEVQAYAAGHRDAFPSRRGVHVRHLEDHETREAVEAAPDPLGDLVLLAEQRTRLWKEEHDDRR